MARTRLAIAILLFAALLTGCNNLELHGQEDPMGENTVKPIGWTVKNALVGNVVFDDGTVIENQEHALQFFAEDSIKVAGTERFAALDALHTDTVTNKVQFQYNHGKVNTLTVEGLTLRYNYNGKTYDLPCLSDLAISGVHNTKEEVTTPAYYELSETVYSLLADGKEVISATQIFVVEEGYIPPTLERVEWDYAHKNYRREATVAGTVLTVVCDNIANFADIYSDGSRQNVEDVPYTVSNKFAFNAPAMKVDDINTVVGRTFTFSNGTVNVAGQTVSAVWKSAAVDGKVMHNDKDYASEITPCKVEAKTITFVSATSAVVKFYNNDAADYAEATVAVSVEENRRLISTDESYSHIAYRRNAEVAGANIAVTCDNLATFVDNYSDGTTENEDVDYTVVNNFSYVVPTFVVNNMSNLLGQSYSFNVGTAVIEGVNVVINFTNRQVGAIMHNGKDYRSNAPVCEVVAKTITITSQTTAVVRFEDKNNSSDYSEAVISINILEAEDLNGEVLGAWITDAYKARTLTSTDLHVLTNNNGVYTVYSRPVNSTTWTATEISAANAMTLLEADKAPAWVWNGSSYEIGVLSYESVPKESTGYIIRYYNFDGVLMSILGDAEAALNGKPFAEPLKAVGSANSDGMWTISYNGFTYYFI